MIKKVSVIGAGTMGNGIAHVFAQNNFEVNLIDVNAEQLEKALQTISKNLDRQIIKGSINEEQKKQFEKRLQEALDDPNKRVDFIVYAKGIGVI